MTTENNDRPPLTSISTSGTYRLKLIRPKPSSAQSISFA